VDPPRNVAGRAGGDVDPSASPVRPPQVASAGTPGAGALRSASVLTPAPTPPNRCLEQALARQEALLTRPAGRGRGPGGWPGVYGNQKKSQEGEGGGVGYPDHPPPSVWRGGGPDTLPPPSSTTRWLAVCVTGECRARWGPRGGNGKSSDGKLSKWEDIGEPRGAPVVVVGRRWVPV